MEQTLDGNAERKLKEYTIGAEALGRARGSIRGLTPLRAGGVASADAAEQYYATAGANDEFRFVPARGSYVPG
ncbi:MAG: hypothetical protein U0R19_31045 [Bryobacteraceae bacterium]